MSARPTPRAAPAPRHAITTLQRGGTDYPEALSIRLGPAAPAEIHLLGDAGLLQCRSTAWLSSSRPPADLVIPALDHARKLREGGVPVVSGFHSPVERECLDLLLRGGQPVLVWLARSLGNARLPKRWREGVERGRMLVLSAQGARVTRPTARSAEARNRFVAALAGEVFVAGTTAGGLLQVLAREVAGRGQAISCFDHPSNHDLLLLGAVPISAVVEWP